jgi:hypothetical protein
MNDIDFETITREEKYLATIKEIRSRNFSNNLPFLILSSDLPSGQSYHEFPDGHIELMRVSTAGSVYRFIRLRTLTKSETAKVRKESGLF